MQANLKKDVKTVVHRHAGMDTFRIVFTKCGHARAAIHIQGNRVEKRVKAEDDLIRQDPLHQSG